MDQAKMVPGQRGGVKRERPDDDEEETKLSSKTRRGNSSDTNPQPQLADGAAGETAASESGSAHLDLSRPQQAPLQQSSSSASQPGSLAGNATPSAADPNLSLAPTTQETQTAADSLAASNARMLSLASRSQSVQEINALNSYLRVLNANRASATSSSLAQSLFQQQQVASNIPGLTAGALSHNANLQQLIAQNPVLATSFPIRGNALGAFPFNSTGASLPPNVILSLLAQSQVAEMHRNLAANTLQSSSLFPSSLGSLAGATSAPFYQAAAAGGTQHRSPLGPMGLLASEAGDLGRLHAAVASSTTSSNPLNSTQTGARSSSTGSHKNATRSSSLSNTVQEDAAIASITQQGAEELPIAPSDADSILLYAPADDTKLSPYQCLARQQLEFFVVKQEDLEAGAQGRNRPIVLGQVGIRCRHCAQVAHRQKQRASAYFPAKLSGVYQTAQNITNTHLCQLCHRIPASIRRNLQLLQSKKSGSGGGRKYWSESADSAGICEVEGRGLHFQAKQGNGKPEEKSSTD